MGCAWIAGTVGTSARTAGRDAIEVMPGVRAGAGTRARIAADGRTRLAVLGDCGADEQQLRAALGAVATGRWGELTGWPGSYWVVAENAHQRFVCGDLAGVRPVFYAVDGPHVQWSSRPGELAAHLGTGPDLELLTARLVAGEQHWPARSPLRGVRMVPGGRGLLLGEGRPQLLDISGIRPVPGLKDGARAFGQALTRAVQHRLPATGQPVGADLSGGLDSSAAALLAAAAGATVHTATYTGSHTSAEDTAFAVRVAEHARLPHHLARGGAAELPYAFEPGIPATDEPADDTVNWTMDTAYLHPVAGLPAHLTGHGGDIVLDGSSSGWVRLLQDGHRRQAHHQVVAFARLRNLAPGPYWRALKQTARQGRPAALLAAASTLEQGPVTPGPATGWTWCCLGTAASWLTAQGRAAVADLLRQAAHDHHQPEHADEFDQWAALRSVGTAARTWQPLAHALGIHPAHPYLDNQVVRAAFAIPAPARRGLDTYKPLLAAALPTLPDWLLSRRSKGSFTAQKIAGLRRHLDRLQPLIHHSPLTAAGLLDPTAAVDSLQRTARGETAAGLADLHHLLATCWWLHSVPQPATASPREAAC